MNIIFAFILLLPIGLQARVFNLNEETIATSVKGGWAPSSVLQTHFQDTSGTGMTIDDSVKYNLGGEIGLVFTGKRAAFRLGLESIHPNPLKDKIGANSKSVEMYKFNSDISVFLPKADIDFVLKASDTWRIFLSLGGGVGTVNYTNGYTFNTAGQAAFGGLADFTEEGTGTGTMMEGGLNFEHLFSDTTTIVFELGYRQLSFDKVTFKKDVTSFTGVHLKGEDVLNADGTAKSINFTGFAGGICFRFYLGK